MGCSTQVFDKIRRDYLAYKPSETSEASELTINKITKTERSHLFPGDITNQPNPYGDNPYYEE